MAKTKTIRIEDKKFEKKLSRFYQWKYPLKRFVAGVHCHHRALAEELKIAENDSILEVGVGRFKSGFQQYSRKAGEFIGLDSDQVIVDHLLKWAQRKERDEEFMLGEAEKLPFPKNRFSHVIFFDFPSFKGMHIDRGKVTPICTMKKEMKEAFRVLKTGGKVSFSITYNAKDYGAKGKASQSDRVLLGAMLDSAKKDMKAAGFREIEAFEASHPMSNHNSMHIIGKKIERKRR